LPLQTAMHWEFNDRYLDHSPGARNDTVGACWVRRANVGTESRNRSVNCTAVESWIWVGIRIQTNATWWHQQTGNDKYLAVPHPLSFVDWLPCSLRHRKSPAASRAGKSELGWRNCHQEDHYRLERRVYGHRCWKSPQTPSILLQTRSSLAAKEARTGGKHGENLPHCCPTPPISSSIKVCVQLLPRGRTNLLKLPWKPFAALVPLKQSVKRRCQSAQTHVRNRWAVRFRLRWANDVRQHKWQPRPELQHRRKISMWASGIWAFESEHTRPSSGESASNMWTGAGRFPVGIWKPGVQWKMGSLTA